MSGIIGLGKNIESEFGKIKSVFSTTTDMVIGRVGSYAGAFGDAIMHGDFIGMDFNQEEIMRDSIKNYVFDIQKTLQTELHDNIEVSKAVKGSEIESAVKSYVQSVVTVAQAFTSQLLAYSDKMADAKALFAQHQSDLSSQVTSQATEISSSAQTYTPR